jgi:3-dehydroquinate dehydratase-1
MSGGRLVAVIATPDSLARATRLRHPPDFFELRLDALHNSLGELARALPKLHAPVILTARHPLEGGTGELNNPERRALLLRFFEHAALIDLELRSVRQMKRLIEKIRRHKIGLIISRHEFRDTPSLEELYRLTNSAAEFKPAIFKLVTRTDTPAQLERLVSFFTKKNSAKFTMAAMGIGKLASESRRRLDRLGSALTYVSLGKANVEGQPSLGQLRRARRAYID